jgi:hypothetical protein
MALKDDIGAALRELVRFIKMYMYDLPRAMFRQLFPSGSKDGYKRLDSEAPDAAPHPSLSKKGHEQRPTEVMGLLTEKQATLVIFSAPVANRPGISPNVSAGPERPQTRPGDHRSRSSSNSTISGANDHPEQPHKLSSPTRKQGRRLSITGP